MMKKWQYHFQYLQPGLKLILTSPGCFFAPKCFRRSWTQLNCCELFVTNLWQQNSSRIHRKLEPCFIVTTTTKSPNFWMFFFHHRQNEPCLTVDKFSPKVLTQKYVKKQHSFLHFNILKFPCRPDPKKKKKSLTLCFLSPLVYEVKRHDLNFMDW